MEIQNVKVNTHHPSDPNNPWKDPRENIKTHELDLYWEDITDFLQGQREGCLSREFEVENALANIAASLYRFFVKSDHENMQNYANELIGIMTTTAEDSIIKQKEEVGEEF